VSAARSPGATEKARAISRRPTLPERLPMNASTSSLEGRGRGLRLRGLAIEVVGWAKRPKAACPRGCLFRRRMGTPASPALPTLLFLLRPTGLCARGSLRGRLLRCLGGAFGRLGGAAARRGRARFGKAVRLRSLARGGTFRRPAAERLGAGVEQPDGFVERDRLRRLVARQGRVDS